MKIDIIAGARPNFVKIAPIINQIKYKKEIGIDIDYRLIHTGQHYDDSMSKNFFKDLDIPFPDINLNVGSSSHAKQTADIMIGYEKVLFKERPDLCLVVGDVNSTMACAIVAKKMNINVAHVEGGIRSNDFSMPEEINRIVTDSISDYFFTTSKNANQNLLNCGVKEDKIFFVGNVMIDTLKKQFDKFEEPSFYRNFGLDTKKFFVLTLHRPSNVDNISKLSELLCLINDNVGSLPIIFPIHPRTSQNFEKCDKEFKNIITVPPLSYLQFNFLVKNSKGIITDSGGITEEATVLNVPCITLRDNTERPETVEIGTNELVGDNKEKIILSLSKILDDNWKKSLIPELWDGCAAERIIDKLLEIKFEK